jgi:hypothetical protein
MKLTIAFMGHVRMTVRVANLEQASQCFAAHRDGFGLGASAMRKGCGDVRQGQKLVGRISYNGRIWDASGKPVDGLTCSEHLQAAKSEAQ